MLSLIAKFALLCVIARGSGWQCYLSRCGRGIRLVLHVARLQLPILMKKLKSHPLAKEKKRRLLALAPKHWNAYPASSIAKVLSGDEQTG